MVTSRALAEIIGEALQIPAETAQLHLKVVREAGLISFKGYGRSAANMTSLDAARLVLAVSGSRFAKDSAEVLKCFAKLKPMRRPNSGVILEDFLARRIEKMPLGITVSARDYADRKYNEWDRRYRDANYSINRPKPFGSSRLADIALQLIEPAGIEAEDHPRYAIVRWLSPLGHSNVMTFGPPLGTEWDEARSRSFTDIYDILCAYGGRELFKIHVVKKDALILIARALQSGRNP